MQERWTKIKVTPALSLPVESLESRLLFSAQIYYLSPSGNDENSGTSTTTAWRTIARANQATFLAGDSLLLQGGATFAGNLTFTAKDTGSAALPITVSSFGAGNATISAGAGDGITVTNTAGINISKLTLTGAGAATRTGIGIDLFDSLTGKPRLSGINISNVSVSGFGLFGIGIGSSTVTSGFNDVDITYSTVYNDDEAGIFSYAGAYTANPAPYGLAHTNIYVGHVTAYGNTGHSGTNDSGNGIELGSVGGAVIERCIAYDNGADNASTSGGPVGIWTYDSNAVTIQYNESYSNTSAHYDGDGFDLDGGVTNSIVQYNYSHDNAGCAILEAQFGGASAHSGNIIRYNISQNDGRKNNYPAIELWAASASDTIIGTEIYGNTIYLTKPSGSTSAGISIDQATQNVQIRNNIIDVAPGLVTIHVKSAGTGLLLQGNDYWTGSATATQIAWGSSTYQTLTAFRAATGQEKVGNAAVGLSVNPVLKAPGSGGTVADADDLASVTAYQLQSTSTLINGGVNLTSLGVNPGSTDFYGNALPTNTVLDIGADQVLKAAPVNLIASSTGTTFYLRSSTDGTILDIWENAKTPGTGTPTLTQPFKNISAINVTASTAGTSLTVDLSTGDRFGVTPIQFTCDASGNSLHIIGTTGNDTIVAATSQITIDTTPIAYKTVQSITIAGNGGADTFTQTGQPSASVIFSFDANDTVAIQAGSFTIPASAKGSGIAAVQIGTLSISSGASVIVQAAAVHTDRHLLELGSLVLAGSLGHWTGRLDLQNNDLIVHNGSLSQLTNMLTQGYDASGKKWTGDGIDSGAAASNTTLLTALGVIANKSTAGKALFGSSAVEGLFDGTSPALTDILIKYTYQGDANLDGRVDGSDLTLTDYGYHKHLTGWFNGDFNYSGSVDASDYTLIDNAYAKQSSSL